MVRVNGLRAQLNAFRIEVNARFDAMQSECVLLRWGCGALAVLSCSRAYAAFSTRARIAGTPAPRLDLAAIAVELGYHDQPHMTHEFAALAGATPQSFAR